MSNSLGSVFLLIGTIDYEGDTVLAVLPSRTAAEVLKQWGEDNKDRHGHLRYGYNSLSVDEWKMGERATNVPYLPST